eukprot:scaffold1442_cov128-Cylindrotheca_fusiformis.AAC.16
MSTNEQVVVTATNPDTIQGFDKLVGGLALFTFVIVWLSSATSPFLFILALHQGAYISALIIALVTILAYLPWKKENSIAVAFQRFYSYYSHLYMRKTTIVFVGDKPSAKHSQQTFYAVHPHGCFCIGWSFFRGSGNPGSASKASMIHYMKRGESLALPPGGFEEATLTCLNQDRVYIQKRTGFVKLCLQQGIPIRPVYVFGEKSCFWNVQGAFPLRLALNRYGLPTILSWGNSIIPLLPKRNVEMYIVVGKPLILPKIEQPTKEDVTKWHKDYVNALKQLFEDHKEAAYGKESKT